MTAQKDTGERSFTLNDLRGETAGWARLAEAADDLRFVPLHDIEAQESPEQVFAREETEAQKSKAKR